MENNVTRFGILLRKNAFVCLGFFFSINFGGLWLANWIFKRISPEFQLFDNPIGVIILAAGLAGIQRLLIVRNH